jgi:hypothetical protein
MSKSDRVNARRRRSEFMAMESKEMSRHDLEAKIVKRCWEDEAFRREFLADPAAAFVKYLGVSPAGLPKISVHEEAAGSWHVVVPAKPADANASGELTDQDLEQIAGGVTSLACVTLGVSITTLGATISAKVTEAKDCW